MASILLISILCLISACRADKLSYEEIDEILDLHNNYRRWVSPPAANMQLMQWSSCLEEVANRYLSTCPGFAHNQNRKSDAQALGCEGSENSVGENLYWYSAYISNNSVPVEAWYDEYRYYDIYSKYCSYICGHYTQIIWADTNLVGCAKFDASYGCYGDSGTYYICNYAPGGNYYSEAPYEIGDACSKCEEGFDYCVGGLCSNTVQSLSGSSAASCVTIPIVLLFVCVFISIILL